MTSSPSSSSSSRDLSAPERFARLSLWAVLELLVLVGAMAWTPLGAQPWTRALLPLALVATVVALRTHARRSGADPAAMRSVLDDELRRQSLARACRDALVAVMALQPLLAWGVTWWPVADPAVLMAGTTSMAGLGTLVASLLLRDR